MLGIPDWIYSTLSVVSIAAVAYFVIRRADVQSIQQQLQNARGDNDELRKRIDDKDRENRDLQRQLDSFKKDLENFKNLMIEKDKRIDILSKVQVTQVSNPEQVAYMSDMRNFSNQVHVYMVETNKMLGELLGKK